MMECIVVRAGSQPVRLRSLKAGDALFEEYVREDPSRMTGVFAAGGDTSRRWHDPSRMNEVAEFRCNCGVCP